MRLAVDDPGHLLRRQAGGQLPQHPQQPLTVGTDCFSVTLVLQRFKSTVLLVAKKCLQCWVEGVNPKLLLEEQCRIKPEI
jgi:hypothetical protein